MTAATDPSPAAPNGMPTPRSDRELLLAAAEGDRQAADDLVRKTYRAVWASLFRMTGGDADLAADLTQDTYRKAWISLKTFDGRARFSTWLYRIAYTTFLNHVRRPRPLVPLEPATAARAEAGLESPEDAAGRSQSDERLRRAVLRLPDPLRETVAARFWGEIPVRQLAADDGISEVAVRKRLRKALAILRHDLEVTS